MPGSKPPLPTELQLFVLRALLQSGCLTVQEVTDSLPAELLARDSNVEQAILELCDAGMVLRHGSAHPARYSAAFEEPVQAAMLLAFSNLRVEPPDSAPETDRRVIQYELPVPPEIVASVMSQSQFLANLASLPPDEVVDHLRLRYRFDNLPHLARVAKAILKLPLSGLSFDGTRYWLTFNRDDVPVSLAGDSQIPQSLYKAFPIQAVPGLEEFLIVFGGMADGYLPASSYFLSPSQAVCIAADDPQYDWGNLGDWSGSLLFYQGASGDQIVIHPDGRPGTWFHDVGWESPDEVAFQPLGMSFPNLIDHFATYIALPADSPKRKKSPFYY